MRKVIVVAFVLAALVVGRIAAAQSAQTVYIPIITMMGLQQAPTPSIPIPTIVPTIDGGRTPEPVPTIVPTIDGGRTPALTITATVGSLPIDSR
jgi:hypothetical protein